MRVRLSLVFIRVIFLMISTAVFVACAPPVGQHPPTPSWLPTTTRIERITLEDARQTAGFHILEPTYVPDSLRLDSVTRVDESIDLEFRGFTPAEQLFVSIIETPYRWPPAIPTPRATPDTGMETARVHRVTALVSRNFPAPVDLGPSASPGKNVSLTWSENNVGIVLEGSFSLDELVRLAESMR